MSYSIPQYTVPNRSKGVYMHVDRNFRSRWMNKMNPNLRGPVPQLLLIISTLGCILISIWCLHSGYTIIFQNLFYIPIILSCILYTKRGFLFSCLLALIYFCLIAEFTQNNTILLQALIRVILFITIAGIITILAISVKESEVTLRHLNSFQDNIIANARVWLMVLDQKGRVLLWNTAAEEISGYRSEEVIGSHDIWKRLYPEKEYRGHITETITRIISTQNSFENFETTIQSKTGNERIISWNTKRITDDIENVSEYIAIGVDVTDKQIIEKALEQQTKFLQILMDTLPVPMFYKNRDGIYTGCNRVFEEYFGKPRDQIIGRSVYDLWPKDLADVYYNADQAVFTSTTSQQYEASVRYADGSVHQVMFYKAPIIDDTDVVTGLVGALLDISERKRSEEALRESNQKLRILYSLTRHDIFNELSAVQLLLNIALESSDPAIIHQYISRALEAGNQIEATIGFTREYENFGTISSGWQGIYRTIEEAKRQVSLENVVIENLIPDDLEIYADPIIRKVFVTLLENAIRHGEKVTEITFFWVQQEQNLILICKDDGVGIPDKEKRLIFNHGFGKNTGIGLFLSCQILSITGLSIRETGEFEKGARFEITVPEGKYRFQTGTVK